jgi:hypothetical protein
MCLLLHPIANLFLTLLDYLERNLMKCCRELAEPFLHIQRIASRAPRRDSVDGQQFRKEFIHFITSMSPAQ